MLFFLFIFGSAAALNITKILRDIAGNKEQIVDYSYRVSILTYSFSALKFEDKPVGDLLELAEAILSFHKSYPAAIKYWDTLYLDEYCNFFQKMLTPGAMERFEESFRVGREREKLHVSLVQLEKCVLLLNNLRHISTSHANIDNTYHRVKKVYREVLIRNSAIIHEKFERCPIWIRTCQLFDLDLHRQLFIKPISDSQITEENSQEKTLVKSLDNQFDLSVVNFEELFSDSSAVQVEEKEKLPFDQYITSMANFSPLGKSIPSLLIFKLFRCRFTLNVVEKAICDQINAELLFTNFIDSSPIHYSIDEFQSNVQVFQSPTNNRITGALDSLNMFLKIKNGFYCPDYLLVPRIQGPSTNLLIQDYFIPYLEFCHTLFTANLLVNRIESEMVRLIKTVNFSIEDIITIWPSSFHKLIPPSALQYIRFSWYMTINNELENQEEEEVINLSEFRDDFFSTYKGFLPAYILRSLKKKHFKGTVCALHYSFEFRSDQDIPTDCLDKMKELEVFFPCMTEFRNEFVPEIISISPDDFPTIENFIDNAEIFASCYQMGALIKFLRERLSLILGEEFISKIADALITEDYGCPISAALFMNTPGRLLKYAVYVEGEDGHPRRIRGTTNFKGTYDMRVVYSWVIKREHYKNILQPNSYIANGYGTDEGGPMRNYLQQCLDFIKNGTSLKKYEDLMNELKSPVNLEEYALLGPLLPESNGLSFFPFRSSSNIGKFVGTILTKSLQMDIAVDITFPEDFFRVLSLIRERGEELDYVQVQVAEFHDKMYPDWQKVFFDIDNLLNSENMDEGELGKYTFPDPLYFREPFKAEPLYEQEERSETMDNIPHGRVLVPDRESLRQLKESIIKSTYSEFTSLLTAFNDAFDQLYNLNLFSLIDFGRWVTLFESKSYTSEDIIARIKFQDDHKRSMKSLVDFNGKPLRISFEDGIKSVINSLSPEMMKRFISAFTGSSSSRLENTNFYIQCNGKRPISIDFTESMEESFKDLNIVKDFYTKVYERQVEFLCLDPSQTVMSPIPRQFIRCEAQTCFTTMIFNIATEVREGSLTRIVRDFGSVVLAILQQLLHDPNDIQS